MQLCTLPWLGFVPDDVTAAPPAAVARLAERLQVPAGALGRYGEREQTRTEHLRAAARYLGWRPAKALELKELEEFLLARAMEHDAPSLLHRLACEYLISAKVIRPGVVALLERVAAARAAAQALTYDTVAPILDATPTLVEELDRLLVVDPEIGSTRLHWLGTAPTEPSPGAVKPSLPSCGSCGGWTRTPWTCRCCRPSGAGSWPGGASVEQPGAGAPRAAAPLPDPADAAGAVGDRQA